MVTHKIRRRDGSIEEYTYYTLREAQERGIKYKSPHKNPGLRVGDFIQTDDGWVCPIIFVNYSTRNPYFRTPTGTFLIYSDYFPITGEKRKNRFSFSGKPPGEGGALSRRQRRFVWEFCKCGDRELAFERAYGRKPSEGELRRIWRYEKIRLAIMKQLQILLQQANIREQEIVIDLIDTYRDLKDVLKRLKKDPSPENALVMTEIADRIEKIIGRLGNWLGYEGGEEKAWGYFEGSFTGLPRSKEIQMIEGGQTDGEKKEMDSEGDQEAGGTS